MICEQLGNLDLLLYQSDKYHYSKVVSPHVGYAYVLLVLHKEEFTELNKIA